jgi:predicted dienelactone hydrolase
MRILSRSSLRTGSRNQFCQWSQWTFVLLVIGSLVALDACRTARAQAPEVSGPLGTRRGTVRQMLKERRNRRNNHPQDTTSRGDTSQNVNVSSLDQQIAGLKVAFWYPKSVANEPHPLVVFSHGFRGINRQSEFIMKALADAGYVVVSPSHADAMGSGKFAPVEAKFSNAAQWSDTTYAKRRDDIVRLLAALKQDEHWNKTIDWSKVALMGHSLGGYTMLGLAGAWPTWKITDVKAVVALSPYLIPYLNKGTLSQLSVPVMYQSGTGDFGIQPFLVGPKGAFAQTPGPSELVVLTGANHFTWSNLNRERSREELINHYCIAFLDKYLRGDTTADPETKLTGVTQLDVRQ